MASNCADGKREVTDHLGRIAAGERWKRRIEPQPPAANQPDRNRTINSFEILSPRNGLGDRKATLSNERFTPQLAPGSSYSQIKSCGSHQVLRRYAWRHE